MQVLLEIHNTLNSSEFFAEARQAICEGRFEQHRAAFLRRREPPDASKSFTGSA